MTAPPDAAPPSPTSTTSTTTGATEPTDLTSLDTGDILGFDLDEVVVGGEALVVAVADDRSERARGLMGVVDFGEVDGMLFEFDILSNGSFWMKDTPTPLDIAFFRADGSLIDVLTMTPCAADPCETYRPDEAYLWALERPAGSMLALQDGTTLER